MNKTISRLTMVFLALFIFNACSQNPGTSDQSAHNVSITPNEVLAAQQAWCDAVVALGQAYTNGEDYRALASDILNAAYDYADGKVFSSLR